MNGTLTFFEIGVADAERGRAFYGSLFGWELERAPNGGGFGITTPTIRGGMHGDDAGASPYIFFEVDDMDAALDRVRALGGEVEEMGGEHDGEYVARFGRFELCRDDQGSRFGLHRSPTASEGSTP